MVNFSMSRRNATFALILLTALDVAHAESARIEGVKLPAWVEHSGVRSPLAAGMAVGAGDSVITGEDARVLMRMPEGSAVKLGENAALRVSDLEDPGSGGLVRASLDVLTGAFRFTTGLAEKFTRQRRVDVHFSVITAGIRGTDLWGETTGDREIVCLLEGKIAVDRPGDATVTMDEPRTYYLNEHAAAAPRMVQLPDQQLARWTIATDIAPASGAQVEGGLWQVTAFAGPDVIAALNAYARLREAGYPVQIRPEGKPGRRRYDVRLPGLASQADANSVAARLVGMGDFSPVVTP